MHLAQCEKLVNSNPIRDRHCLALKSGYDAASLTVSEDGSGLVPTIGYDRYDENDKCDQHCHSHYGWDEVVKFGGRKLLWYESCVISPSDKSDLAQADYLVNRLFSPLSLTSGKIMEDVSVEIAGDSDDDFKATFSRLCQYRKPTLLMVDRPYNQQTDDDVNPDGYTYYDDDDSGNNRSRLIGYNLHRLNFLNLHVKSVPSYLEIFEQFGHSKHTIKVAVFDGTIPSLTDYFENYDKVITADNTLYITCSICNTNNSQLVLKVSKII